MKIAFLGPPGTFGEVAARARDAGATLVPCSSHAEVLRAAAAGAVDEAVIPVENSVEGAVNETVDLMIHESALMVCAELVVKIEQNLVVRPGVQLEDVRTVYSHPQALGQCRGYLDRTFPAAKLAAALSTSAAVEAALEGQGTAAIASARAAELYGARILARDIQDQSENLTRFWVLATRDAAPTGRDKTSIAFKTAHDRPGTLLGVLHELSDRGVNLTKIESRPSKDALGVYVFLVDFAGHRADPTVAEALEAVRRQTSWLKLFGSYPEHSAVIGSTG